MNIMIRRLIGFTAALVLAFQPLAAFAELPVFIRGVRPMAMGGAFLAVSDDSNAFFYNPAGITQRQGSEFTLFSLPLNVSEDTMNFMTFFNGNQDDLKNFDSLSTSKKTDLINKINDTVTGYQPRVRLGFPNISYLSGPGSTLSWGAGFFDQAEIGFQFNRALIVPSISYYGNVDLIGAVPLAHRFDQVKYLPGKLSVGGTLKVIQRGSIAEFNKSVLEFENMDPVIQWGNGFGLDLGALYQPSDRLNLGLVISDFGNTKINYSEVKATKAGQLDKPSYIGSIDSLTNVGASYIPRKIVYWPGKSLATKDRLIIAGDVRDVLNPYESVMDATVFKKIKVGLEYRLGPLSLRGGFNGGYPSFGGGVRIPYLGLKADYAFWGEELGRYAGQMPEWNHQINLAWSWGDAKGRAYGSDVKNVAEPPAKQAVAMPAALPPAPAAVAPAETAPVPAAVSVPEAIPVVPAIQPAITAPVQEKLDAAEKVLNAEVKNQAVTVPAAPKQ